MATVLTFHLLGLYPGKLYVSVRPSSHSLHATTNPVPSTTELLILSPFTPRYTVHNSYLNVSTTVTVKNFDARSVQSPIPAGAAAYVLNVTVNGQPAASRCHFDFYDTFRAGGDIVIEVTADRDAANSCAGGVPQSLSMGGFAQAR